MQHKNIKSGSLVVLILITLLALSACSDGNTTADSPAQGSGQVVSEVANGIGAMNSQPAAQAPSQVASPVPVAAKVVATTTAAPVAKPSNQTKYSYPTSPDIKPFNWGGTGIVHDRYFNSPILGRQMSYRIYLPPQYFTNPGQRFPVLYMLHGLSGSYQEWVDYGLLPNADDMIVANQIEPFIIVLPLGEQSYWINHSDGGPRWGDYMTTDVVDSVDSNYRTIANAQNRAIGGHSMGGFGALSLTFNNPDIFGIVAGHSAVMRTKADAFYFFGDAAYYATIDPITLAKSKDLSSLKIWLDVGKDDEDSLSRTQELQSILQQRGISATFTVWPGTHGGEYWIAHCKDYINFYASAFPTALSKGA